jgi:hypothetical protein
MLTPSSALVITRSGQLQVMRFRRILADRDRTCRGQAVLNLRAVWVKISCLLL